MRSYLLFDEVKVCKMTDVFYANEYGTIWQIHPGAQKRFYIFSPSRNVGEWLSEDQFTF